MYIIGALAFAHIIVATMNYYCLDWNTNQLIKYSLLTAPFSVLSSFLFFYVFSQGIKELDFWTIYMTSLIFWISFALITQTFLLNKPLSLNQIIGFIFCLIWLIILNQNIIIDLIKKMK